jgi:hypothetical protein
VLAEAANEEESEALIKAPVTPDLSNYTLVADGKYRRWAISKNRGSCGGREGAGFGVSQILFNFEQGWC